MDNSELGHKPGPACGAKASNKTLQKNPSGKLVESGQKIMAFNVFLSHLEQKNSKTRSVKLAAAAVGISESTMWKIVTEMQVDGTVSSPKKKRIRRDTYARLDEAEKRAICATVHDLFQRNEIPTLNKLHQAIRNNDRLPSLTRSSLWRLLKKMDISYEKKGKQYILIEKPDGAEIRK